MLLIIWNLFHLLFIWALVYVNRMPREHGCYSSCNRLKMIVWTSKIQTNSQKLAGNHLQLKLQVSFAHGFGPTYLDFLIFLCSLLSPCTFSIKIFWHIIMSSIFNIEHSVYISFVGFCESLFSIFTQNSSLSLSYLFLFLTFEKSVEF